MFVFQKIRLFFVSRSTVFFLKVFFISLPLCSGFIYFIIYSKFGLQHFNKIESIKPLVNRLIYEPIVHNTNSIYPSPSVRELKELKELKTYQKPPALWEGTAIDPIYRLPKQGRPSTPRTY